MSRRMLALLAAAVALVVGAWALIGNLGDNAGHPGHSSAGPRATSQGGASGAPVADKAKSLPLRPGERRLTLTMPVPYLPKAPTGVGTDDYRCFLLDPKLKKRAFLTGYDVLPNNADVVHHVILFRADPDRLARARQLDDASPGAGWTCFGNSGVEQGAGLDDAPWLGAWAPGGSERRYAKGFGMPLTAGSQVILQVHYNLLKGASEDQSAVSLRLSRAHSNVRPLHTLLAVAPVELPCRADHADSPLCNRATALEDVKRRFGPAGATADLLHLICGPVKPGVQQSCARNAIRTMTIRAVAGHMHLLGTSIRLDLIPANGPKRNLLNIKVWNFDNQEAVIIKPVTVHPFDKIKVTCRHEQFLRDIQPAFESQRDDRYVMWGEGSTDEMCLGIVVATFD